MPLGWDEILTILFVVFNPLKVIGPFVALTKETQQPFLGVQPSLRRLV